MDRPAESFSFFFLLIFLSAPELTKEKDKEKEKEGAERRGAVLRSALAFAGRSADFSGSPAR
jgi:hypothetical protein